MLAQGIENLEPQHEELPAPLLHELGAPVLDLSPRRPPPQPMAPCESPVSRQSQPIIVDSSLP